MRTIQTLAAMLTIATLAAPAALARPGDHTPSTATAQDLRSPDTRDAARLVQGEKPQTHFIPKPYDRYYGIDRRVQPTPNPPSASHEDDLPAWLEIAFAGVLLATAGGVVRVLTRRRQRVAA